MHQKIIVVLLACVVILSAMCISYMVGYYEVKEKHNKTEKALVSSLNGDVLYDSNADTIYLGCKVVPQILGVRS